MPPRCGGEVREFDLDRRGEDSSVRLSDVICFGDPVAFRRGRKRLPCADALARGVIDGPDGRCGARTQDRRR
jgi:hypothetical protein